MRCHSIPLRALLVAMAAPLLGLSPASFAQAPARLGLQFYPVLSITGDVASVHTIQFATEISEPTVWQCLAVVQLTNKIHNHLDAAQPLGAKRIYRTVAGPHNLAWVPPGSFVMGSPTTELGRGANESPQTAVTFTRGFFMGKFEVSQESYLSLVGTNPSAFAGGASLPVETVRWGDALTYCAKLTLIEEAAGRLPPGWVYRLPTEAQWEYACRAGSGSRYSFGDDPNYTGLSGYAWFDDPTNGRTHPVGTKLPNPLGLHDMHGNVWELCQDSFTYTGGAVTDPPPAATAPMSRGGSWHSSGARCRSAARNPYDTLNREAWVGFRVVLTAK